MSSNTNTLFWVITGAVIVIGIYLLISHSNDTAIKNIFDTMDTYFQTDGNGGNNNADPEPEPEVEYEQYLPANWNILDVAVYKGVVYVIGNYSNNGGSYRWDVRIINANDYEVHFINGYIAFFDAQTNNQLTYSNLPFDRILAPNGDYISSFTVAGTPIGTINHYITFSWGD